MEGTELGICYAHLFDTLERIARTANKIDESNVWQQANPDSRAIMDGIIKYNLLEGSRLEGREHFADFSARIASGKSGLILMEHYSNLDLPILCYLLKKDTEAFGPDLDRRIVAIAGMKLNEENAVVKAWAEGFSRVVIYPSRSLSKYEDPESRAAEEARSRKINLAAMRAMDRLKKEGKAILVFPSGTRYRPGRPETKKGLREIDSYLRMFDIMIPVSVNGNCLRINPRDPDNMIQDLVCQDRVIIAAGPVIECSAFRKEVAESLPADADVKQAAVDEVMRILDVQHEHWEKVRLS